VTIVLVFLWLLMCSTCVSITLQKREEAVKRASGSLGTRLRNYGRMKGDGAIPRNRHFQAEELFQDVYGRQPKNDAERWQIDHLAEDYLRPLTSDGPDKDAKNVQRTLAFLQPRLSERDPMLKARPALKAWVVWGFTFWSLTVLLYALGLKTSKGEPFFNIIDVGLMATLIEYSGGFESPLVGFYCFSLVLSAYDFAYEERREDGRSFLHRLALILGPYFIALTLNVFWAVSNGVMLENGDPYDYAMEWAKLVFFGAIYGRPLIR